MEEQRFSAQIRIKWRGILWIAVLTILAASASWYVFFGWNGLHLTLEFFGDEKMTLEYGEPYLEPGYQAVLKGNHFLRDGLPVKAAYDVTGQVDTQTVGKYTVKYQAKFCGLRAEDERTVRVIDTVCPVIVLSPDPEDYPLSDEYQEAGYFAYDNYDGEITSLVRRTEEPGKIIYTVLDSSGNPTVVERPVVTLDVTPPEILLNGEETTIVLCGDTYIEPGYSAYDDIDGDLTALVETELPEEIDWNHPGEYVLQYTVMDSSGNVCCAQRHLILKGKTLPDVVMPEGKVIYLTFDDGPGPDTGRLLDILKKYGVKATFFVVDRGYPEIMRRIVGEGHSIGVHTRSHNYNEIYASEEAFFTDAMCMQKIILDTTGYKTWLMRFPGGSSNTVSSFNPGIMTRLTESLGRCGFSYFDWNVDSEDAGGAASAAEVLKNVQTGVLSNRVSIVLQHDIHDFSVDAVEAIIRWGRDNGYSFLPLEINSPGMHHTVQN